MSKLLWIIFQWTWECRDLFNLLISFPLAMYPEVELLNHILVLFLIFLRSFHTVFYRGYIDLHSHQQYNLVNICYFFVILTWFRLFCCTGNGTQTYLWVTSPVLFYYIGSVLVEKADFRLVILLPQFPSIWHNSYAPMTFW